MALAVSLQEFASSMSRLARPASAKIAIALSGGIDSMALAYLASKYFTNFVTLTVDHKMRPESSAEASMVWHSLVLLRQADIFVDD